MTESDSSAFADSVYQPQDDGGLMDHPEPDFENALGEPDDEDVLPGYSPNEKPLGLNRHGTTGVEESERETLEERTSHEVPEVWDRDGEPDGLGDAQDTDGELVDDQVGDRRSGRLVAPDEGAHTDVEKDVVARDVGIDGGAASAEEAAVHVIEDDEARW